MTLPRATARATTVLATLTVIAALWLGSDVLVPVAIAAVLAAVLRPVVRQLEGWGIPAPVGSAAVVLSGIALLLVSGSALSDPVREWSTKAPAAISSAVTKLQPLFRRLGRFRTSLSPPAVRDSTGRRAPPPASPTTSAGPDVGSVAQSAAAPVAAGLLGGSARILGSILETVLLLFFFLAAGHRWNERLREAAPGSGEAALETAHEISRVVSRYLGALTLINLGQGLVVAIVMALIGLPNPALWGVLAFVAEFLPYVGSTVMIVLLTVVGMASDRTGAGVLLAPAAYLAIAVVQTNLVSPLLYGHRLKLNPAAIFLSLMIWWFLWGVPGVFLAVPLLAAGKVLCDRIPGLRGVSAFVSE
ncbi:MAG: AI-2E family transporter [Gemmatimonadota bacterium]